MADFEGVAAIRGARLADLSQHVADVLSVALAAGDEYVVGTLSLESYEFVPYALTGLAAAMQTPGAGEPRASTVVTVPIRDDKAGTGQAQRPVTLYGPGDVLGVDPGQVVRRYPSPGSVNAEETFHAHIEFDRPELPWTFSAQTPGNTMRPWLALVVLERSEVEWEPARAGLQPVMAVDADRLPPVSGAAAAPWAHAQVPKGPASLAARLSTAFAPVNVSRLLAARVLTQNTDYVACLVPTTDAGVKAGLGLPAGTLGAAWTPADGRVRLPVYDHWEFRTAPDGDFARLARRLVPLAAPWEIGRRILDTSRPGDPIADLPAGADGRRQVVRCALVSPNGPPPGAPADDAAWSVERTRDLQDAVERAAVLEGNAGTDPGEVPDLPLVGPRLYAKGQRGAATMPVDDWFSQLNTRPVNRVVAGLGTRVVQRDQEPLMQAAWAQVGEIDKANRALLLAQLARHTAASLHGRLAKLDPGRLLQVVRPVAPRLKVDGASLTLSGQTARSATPVAALGGGFRKALRAAGPVTRRLSAQESGSLARLVASADGARDFSRAYAQLDGIGGLSAAAIAGLDTVAVGQGLRIAPGEVVGTLTRASDVLVRNVGLATAVTTPDVWRAPDATFKVGEAIAQRVGRRIADHVPVDPATDVVASRWLGGLAGGLATTRLPGTVTMNETALRLDASVTEVTERAHAVHAGPVEVGPVVRPGLAVRGRGAAMLRAGAALRPEPVRVAAGVPFGLANLSGVARGRVDVPIDRPVAVGAAGGGVRAVLTDQERLERISTPQGRQLAAFVERADRVTVTDMRADLAGLVAGTGALALASTPVRDTLAVTRADLVTRLDPARTVVAATSARLVAGSRLPADWFADTLIRPIMAAPRFDRPMYQALDQYDREWLVPGLTTLKASELVTVLSTNDVFTESFLVGLSDEMGRELLWRSYPTDMRGTYFHRFWDPTADELSRPIHRFRGTGLGTHVTTDPADRSGRAVVMIRGELVRRYPDLTVMALRETGAPDAEGRPRLPEAPTGPPDAVRSLFHAPLPPDILMAGLDITVDRLREDGWWIVLAEHPQATRFRRSERDLAGHEVRFGSVAAGATGATVAAARLENPTRIAFKAHDFLPSAG